MTCEERQRYWEQRLDARDGESLPVDPGWDAHLDSCERCLATSSGFEMLAKAVEAWPPVPPASAASMARLKRLGADRLHRPRSADASCRMLRFACPLALAASALAIAWLGSPPEERLRSVGQGPMARSDLPSSNGSVPAIRPLPPPTDRPMARRSTRSGRRLIDLGPIFAFSPAGRPRSEAAMPGEETPVESSTRRERRPIADSAVHAFGFLLGPEAPQDGGERNGL